MKCRFSILLFFLTFYLTAQSKLSIRKGTEQHIHPSDKALFKFIADNAFSYALINWTTSGWIGPQYFYCLIKQNEGWFLAEVIRSRFKNGVLIEGFHIEVKEKPLTSFKADSLLSILKPDFAFLYTQWEFNNLPDRCKYQKDERDMDFHVLCSYSDHLLEYSPAGKHYLNFYSPKNYFDYCYPYLSGFKILKDL